MAKKSINRGIDSFNQFFKTTYGNRWEALYVSLSKKGDKIARLSFSKEDLSPIPFLKNAIPYDSSLIDPEERQENGLKKYYIMDPASALVGASLKIEPGDKVLDMCAAPGGKALILIEALKNEATIQLNEFSNLRRGRLKKVLEDYVPAELMPFITVSGHDAQNFGVYMPNTYSKILLDAPCSGEKHLIHDQGELSQWTESRTKKLSMKQFSLLCSALLALKKDGEMIYSTCSISPYENDLVIKKLIDKKGTTFEVIPMELSSPWAERTEYGQIHLPDNGGMGPLYMVKLKKI